MISGRVVDALKSAELIVRKLLSIKPGEEVFIIADPETDMEMPYALAAVIQDIGAEYTLAIQPTRAPDRFNDLTRVIEKGLEGADVYIGITYSSGAPCYARKIVELLNAKRIRGMSMVMRDLDNWTKGAATADYDEVLRTCQRLREVWDKGKEIRVTSELGTDFTSKIGDHRVIIEAGFAINPGESSAFSDGEVSQGPMEGTSEGVIVIDGPIAKIGLPAEPIRMIIEKGRVIRVDGASPQARQIRRIIEAVKDADNIAEVGIGCNPKALRNGDFEEEKKASGNVHIAIGDNIYYGGTIRCAVHMDMVLYNSTVWIDDRVVVENGELKV